MNNKIFSPGEVVTIRNNLRNIEKNLGHSVPGGYIDYSDLKDHILSPGEVVIIARNIRSVSGSRRGHYNSHPSDGGYLLLATGVLVIVGILLLIVESIFNINIL